MEAYYGMTFARGSGAPAKACAEEFVKKFGRERLKEVAKLHFAISKELDA